MRILEVRDGFIKFETDENLALSSFLQIDGFKRYIAQIIKLTNYSEKNIGYAKIAFTYDGNVNKYDGSEPDVNSEIKPLGFELFSTFLNCKDPILSGYFIQDEIKIELDKECYDKNLLITVDNPQNCDRLLSNLKQVFSLTEKVLIIDMLGVTTGRKYTAAKDFKLPLNTDTLEFLYDDCLNDATSDSKDLIKDIFKDLSLYSATVPFLPFSTLKTIVDDMVNNSHVFKLIVLKNKLAKFDKLNYFASNIEEAKGLDRILDQKEALIDLSKIDANFQNKYLDLIYRNLEKMEEKPQIFVVASNAINKKSLKIVLKNSPLKTTLVTHSRFKYLNEIKVLFKNFIIEPSFSNNEVFKAYKVFLEKMPKDTYLIVGEATNSVPLISLNKEFILEPIEIVVEQDDSKYEELAEALEINVEKDEQTQAIDKKSEDLIEKISQKLDAEQVENIEVFETSEEEDDVEESERELVINEITDDSNDANNENMPSEVLIEQDAEDASIADEDTDEEIEEIVLPKDIQEFTIEDDENEADYTDKVEQVESVADVEYQVDNSNADIIEVSNDEIVNPDFLVEDIDEIKTEEDEIIELVDENIIEEEIENTVSSTEEISIEEDSTDFEEIVVENTDDDIIELEDIEDDNETILISIDDEDENLENDIYESNLEKEIIEDVNKVYTTIKEDVITDSDLDFIDELNNDSTDELESGYEEISELEENSDEEVFLEPLEEINDSTLEDKSDIEVLETKSSSTSSVPIYDADIPQEDMVESDTLEQGDTVYHAKYGNGIVEKMIKYGAKTLYSINFDNVGRRLLDPTLTEIKKS